MEGGRAPMIPVMVTAPPQLVHLNFTSFKTTTNLNELPKVKHILVIVNHFTRYTRANVTKDQKALTAAKTLYEGFIERILTDQGKAFTSEVVEQLCSQFEINQLTTTAYHPQGNSQVEQAHQTLGRLIGKLEDEYKEQWPRHLLKLTHAYNCSRSVMTSYLPHFLMFGQWPRLPIDFVFPTHEVMGTSRPVGSYVAELITALRKAFKLAQNMTQTEALRKKQKYIQKALTVTLNKGNVVLIRNDQFVGKRKLKNHWGDKVYTVCNQVNVDVPVYVIENQQGQRQTLHQNQVFLIKKVDPKVDPQVAVRLFNVASTQIGSEVFTSRDVRSNYTTNQNTGMSCLFIEH